MLHKVVPRLIPTCRQSLVMAAYQGFLVLHCHLANQFYKMLCDAFLGIVFLQARPASCTTLRLLRKLC
jgi:hypothetical protein